MNNGKIYVVGIGPGNMQDISIRAYNILKNINVIAGYTTYVDLVKDEFPDKEFLVSGMKREIERCREVLEVAKSGKNVVLISSGDAGIYGMAGIMLEVAMGSGIEVEVVPGITSTIAGNLFLPYYGIVWLNIFLAFRFRGEQVSVFLKS